MKGIKTIRKILLGMLVFVVAAALLLCLYIWAKSPGILPPTVGSAGQSLPNSISEKTFVEIGGRKQGMFIRGEDRDKPVLLFLHGGPGSPELGMAWSAETEDRLEREFVVCYWDQRGAGMSYSKDIQPEELTVSRVVEDAKEVTDYLRNRFGQEKIYLMGHSWGSYLGIKTAEAYPEAYHAFMGMGQVCKQRESEALAYRYMLDHAKEIGDKRAVKRLEAFDPASPSFPENAYIMGVRTNLMNRYGIGVMHNETSMAPMIWNLLRFPGYTFREKLDYLRGMSLSDSLFETLIEDDLFVTAPKLAIPTYILHGVYDYQVSQVLAEAYLNALDAPQKNFYPFVNSAHSPIWEEPSAFMDAVEEILEQVGGA